MTKNDNNKIAALAYFPIVGLILAYMINMEKKDKFISAHMRQSLALVLIGFGISLVTQMFYFLFFQLANIVNLVMFAVVVYAAYTAYNGKKFIIPIIGEYAEKHFTFL